MVLVIFWIYVIDNQYCVVNNKTKTIQAKFNKFDQALDYIKQRSCLNFNSTPICINNDNEQLIEKKENNNINNNIKKNLLEKIKLINENIDNQILDNINIEKEILILKALFDDEQNIKNIQYSHFDNTLFEDENLDFKIDNLEFDSFSNDLKLSNSNSENKQVSLKEKENIAKTLPQFKIKKNKGIVAWILFSIMLIGLLVTFAFYFKKPKNNDDISINFNTPKINFSLIQDSGNENQVINFNKNIKNLKLINKDANIEKRLKFNISNGLLIIEAINNKDFFTPNDKDNIQNFSLEFKADNCKDKSKLEISIRYINKNSSVDWINEATLLVYKESSEELKKHSKKEILYNKDIRNIDLLKDKLPLNYSKYLELVIINKEKQNIILEAKPLDEKDTSKSQKLDLKFKLVINNKEEEKTLTVNIFYINSHYLKNDNIKFFISKEKNKNNDKYENSYTFGATSNKEVTKIKELQYINSDDELNEYRKYFSFPDKNNLNEHAKYGTIYFYWMKNDHFDNIIKKYEQENKDKEKFTFKFYMTAKNVWNKAEITIDIIIGEIPKIEINEKEILLRFNEEKIINYKIVDGIENEQLKACIKEEKYKNKFNVNVEKDCIKIKLINDDYKEGAHLSLSYKNSQTIDLEIKKIGKIDLSQLKDRIGMYKLDEGVKDITRLTPEDKKGIIWQFLKANEQYLKENNLILDETNKDKIIGMLKIEKIGTHDRVQELRYVDILVNNGIKDNYFENKKLNVWIYIKNIDLANTSYIVGNFGDVVINEDPNNFDKEKMKKILLDKFVDRNKDWLMIEIKDIDIVKGSAKNKKGTTQTLYKLKISKSNEAEFIEGEKNIEINLFWYGGKEIMVDLEKLFN